ncbi:hypothetical protein HK096_004622, partial [Nowakowskiella sp. JEL0078]
MNYPYPAWPSTYPPTNQQTQSILQNQMAHQLSQQSNQQTSHQAKVVQSQAKNVRVSPNVTIAPRTTQISRSPSGLNIASPMQQPIFEAPVAVTVGTAKSQQIAFLCEATPITKESSPTGTPNIDVERLDEGSDEDAETYIDEFDGGFDNDLLWGSRAPKGKRKQTRKRKTDDADLKKVNKGKPGRKKKKSPVLGSSNTPNDNHCPICEEPHADDFCICCDVCQRWFHGSCVDLDEDASKSLDAWYCASCTLTSPVSPSVPISALNTQNIPSIQNFTSIQCIPKIASPAPVALSLLRRCRNWDMCATYVGSARVAVIGSESAYCSHACGIKFARAGLRAAVAAKRRHMSFANGDGRDGSYMTDFDNTKIDMVGRDSNLDNPSLTQPENGQLEINLRDNCRNDDPCAQSPVMENLMVKNIDAVGIPENRTSSINTINEIRDSKESIDISVKSPEMNIDQYAKTEDQNLGNIDIEANEQNGLNDNHSVIQHENTKFEIAIKEENLTSESNHRESKKVDLQSSFEIGSIAVINNSDPNPSQVNQQKEMEELLKNEDFQCTTMQTNETVTNNEQDKISTNTNQKERHDKILITQIETSLINDCVVNEAIPIENLHINNHRQDNLQSISKINNNENNMKIQNVLKDKFEDDSLNTIIETENFNESNENNVLLNNGSNTTKMEVDMPVTNKEDIRSEKIGSLQVGESKSNIENCIAYPEIDGHLISFDQKPSITDTQIVLTSSNEQPKFISYHLHKDTNPGSPESTKASIIHLSPKSQRDKSRIIYLRSLQRLLVQSLKLLTTRATRLQSTVNACRRAVDAGDHPLCSFDPKIVGAWATPTDRLASRIRDIQRRGWDCGYERDDFDELEEEENEDEDDSEVCMNEYGKCIKHERWEWAQIAGLDCEIDYQLELLDAVLEEER